MKKYMSIALALFLIVAAGCKARHPSMIKIDEGFDPGKVTSILVVPVISSITQGEDPNRDSEKIPNRILLEKLNGRGDYKFLSPEQFRLAMTKAGLGNRIEEFRSQWISKQTISREFLDAMRAVGVDMILVPQIYLWHKDEADYREASSASVTQVGMTLSLIDPSTGNKMWEATDENFKESVRTEGERIQASTYGIDRRVAGRSESGKDVYAAPPFEDVAILVIQVLVDSFPMKVVSGG